MRQLVMLLVGLTLMGCDGLGLSKGKETAAVDPNNIPPLTSREQSLIFAADGAYQQGNVDEAEHDYMVAAADSKGRIDAHLSLARLYAKQGAPEKQRDILERALKLQPTHPLANYLLGKLYLDAANYDRALAAFKQGRVSRPDDADLQTGEALANDMLGDHKAAQVLYLAALKHSSDVSRNVVRTNLAMSYILSNEPQKAIDLLRDEASKPTAAAVSRHNLALAYGLIGRHSDAKAVLNGDIDEPTRLLALARMKAYHEQHVADRRAPTPVPSINQIEEPQEITPAGPAPVVTYPPVEKRPTASAAKPDKKTAAAKPKPVATQAVAEQKAPAKPVKEAAVNAKKANALAPATPAAVTYDPTQDPNYIPGLTDSD